MKIRNKVLFYLNGKRHEVGGDHIFQPFAEYLRYVCGLTGTKIVCAEGDCGACTVLRAQYLPKVKSPPLEAVNSCILLVAHMDGCHVVTVEGLKKNNNLHPVQEAMIACNGSQCGYCTPGFVMAMAAVVEKNHLVDKKNAKNALTGNLCRCTGYQPIVEATVQAAKAKKNSTESLAKRYLTLPSSRELSGVLKKPIHIETEMRSFFAPTAMSDLKRYLKRSPKPVIMGAATDLGVQYNKGMREFQDLISLHLVPELYSITFSASRVSVGARVTLAELRRVLNKKSPTLSNILDLFASPQIKNVATLVGNVANASPIADTPPFLLSLNANVNIFSGKSGRKFATPLNKFYLSYRKTVLVPGDIITSIDFEIPKTGEVFQFFKNSMRKDLDISCVNASAWIKYKKASQQIEDIRLSFGGVAGIPLRLYKTENILKGTCAEPKILEKSIEALQKEITPRSDIRGSEAYRRIVAENIFRNFFV